LIFFFIAAALAGRAVADVGGDGPTFSLDLHTHYQVIDNFGANDAWSMQKVGGWSEANKRKIADLLFSTSSGIGLSCWRFNIGAGINHASIRDPWRTVETFEVGPGKYDWTRQANERWFLRAARAEGVRQFLATIYSPPLRLTRNGLSNLHGDKVSTTNLKEGAEGEFARYIADILRHFESNPDPAERIRFNYVLPINEPQWAWEGFQEGNRASNDDIRRIYSAVKAALDAYRLGTHILGPDSGDIPDMYQPDANATKWWHAPYGDYLHLICGDPSIARCMGGVISYHSYWSDNVQTQLVQNRKKLADAFLRYPGWKLWMSEYCVMEPKRDLGIDTALRAARIIHADLTIANASSWQWWMAVSQENYKSGLIYTDYKKPGDAESIYPSKLFWVMGNFSRFIRPGAVRVELSGPQDISGLMGSAYINPDTGRVVLVFVNIGQAARRISFGDAFTRQKAFTSYTTSATEDLARGRSSLSTDGYTVPARSVVTLVSD
jgi:O-glycosyl hydrolase